MYDFLNWNPNSKTNYMLQFLRVMQHSQYITTPTHQKYKPATSSSTHYHTIQPKSTQPLLGKNIGTKRSLDKEHHWMEFDTQQLSATYMWWISRKQVSTSTLSHLLPTLHYEEQLNPHKWPSKQHYDMSATMSWTHTTPLYKHEKDFQAMQASMIKAYPPTYCSQKQAFAIQNLSMPNWPSVNCSLQQRIHNLHAKPIEAQTFMTY